MTEDQKLTKQNARKLASAARDLAANLKSGRTKLNRIGKHIVIDADGNPRCGLGHVIVGARLKSRLAPFVTASQSGKEPKYNTGIEALRVLLPAWPWNPDWVAGGVGLEAALDRIQLVSDGAPVFAAGRRREALAVALERLAEVLDR